MGEPDNILRFGSFTVSFDHYTPRPHLIIKNHSFPGKASDPTRDQQREVTDVFNGIKNQYPEIRRSTAILVAHLGYYQSKQSPHFHLHVAVDKDWYIKKLREFNYTPIKRWRGISAYINAVRQYPSQQARKQKSDFLPEDLQEIEKVDRQQNYLDTPSGNIVLHPFLPCIGFSASTGETEALMWIRMMDFAKHYGMASRGDGCHVCLGGQPTPPFETHVSGYILASASTYYRMLPDDGARSDWLGKYKNAMNSMNYPILT